MNNCAVTMKKYFLDGMLEGKTIVDTMKFLNWDAACEWAGAVTMNPACNYVVLEMTNDATGEMEMF